MSTPFSQLRGGKYSLLRIDTHNRPPLGSGTGWRLSEFLSHRDMRRHLRGTGGTSGEKIQMSKLIKTLCLLVPGSGRLVCVVKGVSSLLFPCNPRCQDRRCPYLTEDRESGRTGGGSQRERTRYTGKGIIFSRGDTET